MIKQSVILSFLLASVLPFVTSCQAAPKTMEWNNPIVAQRADPHVFLHTDGCYYMAATVPAYDRIEIRKAETIGGLSTAKAKAIWHKHDKGEMGAHIWAPEIHYVEGKWYVYFTAAPAEHVWSIRPHVLECADQNPLTGKWVEKGKINLPWQSFSLDATIFTHKGKLYYSWTQTEEGIKGTNIYIAEMDSPTSITGKPVLLTRPEFDWERRGHWVNEAPAVLIWKDKVYMTYSASATDANYCLGLLTADADANLLDAKSWTKSKEPVLKSNDETSQYGPGHNCFTTTPDGKKVIMVYHARNYKDIKGSPLHNPDRATRAQELKWTKDGQPDFGVPVKDGPYKIEY